MSDEIWARRKGEKDRPWRGFQDYLAMREGKRTLSQLYQKYEQIWIILGADPESELSKPPTKSFGTIKKWSAKFDWQERTEAYDAFMAKEVHEVRKEVLTQTIKKESQSEAEGYVQDLREFRENLHTMGLYGQSIAANTALIVNNVTQAIAKGEKVPYKTDDLLAISACSAMYRSMYNQGAVVAMDASAKALGLDQMFYDLMKKGDE